MHRPRTSARAFLAALLLTPVLSAQERGEAERPYRPKPIPAGPEAYTAARQESEKRAWMDRVFLAAYREHGTRSPEWDADVEKLIAAHVRYWFEHEQLDVDEKQRLAEASLALVKRGIEDGLVYYLASYDAYECLRTQEARDLGERAIELYASSGYPPMFRYWALSQQMRLLAYRKESARGKKYERPRLEALADAAGHPMYTNGNQRFYAAEIGPRWRYGKEIPDDAAELVQLLEERPKSDPWLVALLRGWLHIGLGWKARTGGTADTVTEAGWRKFYEHMEDARLSLRRAHELHPEYPEAAAAMIYVRMAHEDEASLREWFDRAVAAQLDYWDAYVDYLWANMPRWGGSHQTMLRFAQEALETGRFDTSVPEVYLRALMMIASDYDEEDRLEVYRKPKVYDGLRTCCKGYAEARPAMADKLRSQLVVYAWAAGRIKAAAAVRHELGERYIEDASQYLQVDETRVLRDLQPYLEELRKQKAPETKPAGGGGGGGER
jgi:hypothetical protein